MPVKMKDAPRKGEVTRMAIEDSAVELFLAQGYHATSMRQIAESVGLALGGIYNHFSSKEEIFEAIIIDKHPYKSVLPAVIAAEGESLEDMLRNAARLAVKEIKRRPSYLNLMFIEFVEFNGKHGALILRELGPALLPVFERLVKDRKDLRITNPAMLLRSFFGTLISFLITEMVLDNSHINLLMPKNPMDVYLDIYLHGILKEPA